MHIAVTGNIGAGKTTLTTMLSKHNNWDAQFSLMGNTFCSSTFSGCSSPDANLSKSSTINVLRPSLSFDKKVRRRDDKLAFYL